MPSISGVTIATSAIAYSAHSSSNLTPRLMKCTGMLLIVAYWPLIRLTASSMFSLSWAYSPTSSREGTAIRMNTTSSRRSGFDSMYFSIASSFLGMPLV